MLRLTTYEWIGVRHQSTRSQSLGINKKSAWATSSYILHFAQVTPYLLALWRTKDAVAWQVSCLCQKKNENLKILIFVSFLRCCLYFYFCSVRVYFAIDIFSPFLACILKQQWFNVISHNKKLGWKWNVWRRRKFRCCVQKWLWKMRGDDEGFSVPQEGCSKASATSAAWITIVDTRRE